MTLATVRSLGEKAFIRRVLAPYASTAGAGRQDDCVVIDSESLFGVPDLPYLVYSMDHPSRIDRPVPAGLEWRFYGRWLTACTCNDVLAMGARPRGFALDLAVPNDTELTCVTELYDGVQDVLQVYGAQFEGGNTDINPAVNTVAMCWGTVSRAGVVRRRGARPGDHIAVTAPLGIGWASYLVRKRGLSDRLSPAAAAELAQYNLFPLAPHQAIVDTVQRLPGAITSGMDLSDGLVEFLYTIAESSDCGSRLDEQLLPVPPVLAECAGLLGVEASMLAIEYGFDTPRAHGYTIAPEQWPAVEEIFQAHGTPIHRVGTVTAEPGQIWVAADGTRRQLGRFWDDKSYRDSAVQDWTAMVADLTRHPASAA